MKKWLLSILTIVYMTVSSGIAMEIHFCMGERTGTDLFVSGSKKCGRCGMEEKKGGCCSDEQKFYKLSDEHKIVTNDYAYSYTAGALIIDEQPLQIALVTVQSPAAIIPSPPDDPGPPIYIANRVFRI